MATQAFGNRGRNRVSHRFRSMLRPSEAPVTCLQGLGRKRGAMLASLGPKTVQARGVGCLGGKASGEPLGRAKQQENRVLMCVSLFFLPVSLVLCAIQLSFLQSFVGWAACQT